MTNLIYLFVAQSIQPLVSVASASVDAVALLTVSSGTPGGITGQNAQGTGKPRIEDVKDLKADLDQALGKV